MIVPGTILQRAESKHASLVTDKWNVPNPKIYYDAYRGIFNRIQIWIAARRHRRALSWQHFWAAKILRCRIPVFVFQNEKPRSELGVADDIRPFLVFYLND